MHCKIGGGAETRSMGVVLIYGEGAPLYLARINVDHHSTFHGSPFTLHHRMQWITVPDRGSNAG
jgi:hypothetical protein